MQVCIYGNHAQLNKCPAVDLENASAGADAPHPKDGPRRACYDLPAGILSADYGIFTRGWQRGCFGIMLRVSTIFLPISSVRQGRTSSGNIPWIPTSCSSPMPGIQRQTYIYVSWYLVSANIFRYNVKCSKFILQYDPYGKRESKLCNQFKKTFRES